MGKWGLVVLAWSAVASAQPDRSAALFDQGRALAMHGDYAAACARFEESYALDPAVGTELNLGDCQQHLGHLADAWRRFDDAATRLEAAHDARVTFARARRDALAARLGVVVVEHADPRVVVTIAGRAQPSGAELREHVDPGEIEIHAGDVTRHARVAAGATVVIDLTPRPAEVAGRPAPAVAPPGERPRPARRSRRVVFAYALGGLGVVSGGVALGLALDAHAAYDRELANGDCMETSGRPVCNATGARRQRDAIGLANVGTALAITGIGAMIAGVVVYATAPKDHVVVTLAAEPGGARIIAAGSF